MGKHIWERSKKKTFFGHLPLSWLHHFCPHFSPFRGGQQVPWVLRLLGLTPWKGRDFPHHLTNDHFNHYFIWPLPVSRFVTKYFWSKKSQICASFTIGSFLIWESGCNQSLAGLSHLSKPYDCIHHHQRVIITITIAQKVPISIL